jgi:twinkle protein
MKDGPAALAAIIEDAEAYPIRGLFKFSDFQTEIDDFYALGRTTDIGASTGWWSLDKFYRVVRKQPNCSLNQANCSLNQAKCSLNQAKCSLNQANCSLNQANCSLNHANCSLNQVPGELSVVTGVPNSGKSEWIDALICNLALNNGWTFALCSMENKVGQYARTEVFHNAQYWPDSVNNWPDSVNNWPDSVNN